MATQSFSPTELAWLKETFAAAGISKGVAAVEVLSVDQKSPNEDGRPPQEAVNDDLWKTISSLKQEIEKTLELVDADTKRIVAALRKSKHPAAIHAAAQIEKDEIPSRSASAYKNITTLRKEALKGDPKEMHTLANSFKWKHTPTLMGGTGDITTSPFATSSQARLINSLNASIVKKLSAHLN